MPELPGPIWRKATYSVNDGACVEVADLDGGHRAIRDSKNPIGPALTVGPAQWIAFTSAIDRGEVG